MDRGAILRDYEAGSKPGRANEFAIVRWNPFARKFGILGVIHAHSKRNRVVSKHGRLNTYRRAEENQESHRSLEDLLNKYT